MNDAQLLEQLHRADAYASGTTLPDVIWPVDLALREIERRTTMSEKTTETRGPAAETRGGVLPPKRPLRDADRTRRRWIVGLAAAAVVVIVGLLAALLRSGGTSSTTAPPVTTLAPSTTVAPSTTLAPTTTVAPTTTSEATAVDPVEAQALAQRFFADINSGDLDGAFAVFAEDATFGYQFGSGNLNRYTRDQQLEIFAWNVGQGTRYEAPVCSITEEGDPVVLVCDATIYDAPGQVADVGGVPVDATVHVGEDGVLEYVEVYKGQDFNAARARFEIWMEEQHPGVLAEIDFRGWSGSEEALTDGEQLATYAELWQEFLTENGCEPDLLCS